MKHAFQKIYPITDRRLSGRSHADQVAHFVAGGAALIQLREKDLASREFFEDAKSAITIAHSAGAKVLINDRVDIALMCGADGVHLGQDDLSAAAARRILGDRAIIGRSTHSLDQVSSELKDGNADYLAYGPIFATKTKSDHEPLVGLDSLSEVRKLVVDVPLVAIGGIDASNLASVIKAGADSAAMISELYQPDTEISACFSRLMRIAQDI